MIHITIDIELCSPFSIFIKIRVNVEYVFKPFSRTYIIL